MCHVHCLFTLLWIVSVLSSVCINLGSALVHNEEADHPLKRLNPGHYLKIAIPLESALERLRTEHHRRSTLIRALEPTALAQRAGRNLLFRFFLATGYTDGYTNCTAQIMCEQACLKQEKQMDYFDAYPTDDSLDTYVLGAIGRGHQLGARQPQQCNACRLLYPHCPDDDWRQKVLIGYKYLLQVTNDVLGKIPL